VNMGAFSGGIPGSTPLNESVSAIRGKGVARKKFVVGFGFLGVSIDLGLFLCSFRLLSRGWIYLGNLKEELPINMPMIIS